mmetsp:Transcript_11551/g.42796  ORF Transcript_11551/g.42796 Transcript_11551/m.42796 type:complete len:203 (-) Transcript_11551:46-654(-)
MAFLSSPPLIIGETIVSPFLPVPFSDDFPDLFSKSHCASFSSRCFIFASRAKISSGVGPSSGLSARYAFFQVFRCLGGFPIVVGALPGSYHAAAQCGHHAVSLFTHFLHLHPLLAHMHSSESEASWVGVSTDTRASTESLSKTPSKLGLHCASRGQMSMCSNEPSSSEPSLAETRAASSAIVAEHPQRAPHREGEGRRRDGV